MEVLLSAYSHLHAYLLMPVVAYLRYIVTPLDHRKHAYLYVGISGRQEVCMYHMLRVKKRLPIGEKSISFIYRSYKRGLQV